VKGASPQISVIIPAYHSVGTIATCLAALRDQTFRSFETIVVNSSEDETEAIVTARFPEVVFEQSPKRLLPHAARNRGVVRARGELLVFTDPDCIPAPAWLERLVDAVDDGHTIVQGRMGLRSRSWLERGVHLCKWHGVLGGPARALPQVATSNACYVRKVWEEAGPFEEELFCGDALLSWRAARLGQTLWFEPKAAVDHIHSQSVTSLCKERFARGEEYGLARARHERLSRARASVRFAALPVLLAAVVVRAGRAALQSGWFRSFVSTLPVNLAGQVAWSIGEAMGYARSAVAGTRAGVGAGGLGEAHAGR
jgi:GT2 family glycosyltransferase